MENKEHLYSQDGINYGSYDDLMSELPDFYNIGERVVVWEADKFIWKHVDFINVEGFIYDMQEQSMDVCGEAAEEYLNELTDNQKEDLKNNISKWFIENNIPIEFHVTGNPRKIVVVVE